MPIITYGGQSYQCPDQVSVLDCLTAHGVTIPSSCHAGLCQTCMMQLVDGNIPASAQSGIRNTLAAQNYFLACACYPEENIEVALPSKGAAKFSATVTGIRLLNTNVMGVQLLPDTWLNYRAGQFISLYKDAANSRTYSLASVPEIDEYIQLHIRKVPNGLVSQWVHHQLKVGDKVDISEAIGDCFYTPDNAGQSLLLVGTGCGLAPLYGVIRDALSQGHLGPIKLYHGADTIESLYLSEELEAMSIRYPNFKYVPCISGNVVPHGCAPGMVLDVALAENPDLSGWRVFLCGHPEMVSNGKKQVFFAGASMRDIYADPFISVPKNTEAEQLTA
jgi:NAD(P)H-flavin reductase/ferredoxin